MSDVKDRVLGRLRDEGFEVSGLGQIAGGEGIGVKLADGMDPDRAAEVIKSILAEEGADANEVFTPDVARYDPKLGVVSPDGKPLVHTSEAAFELRVSADELALIVASLALVVTACEQAGGKRADGSDAEPPDQAEDYSVALYERIEHHGGWQKADVLTRRIAAGVNSTIDVDRSLAAFEKASRI